MRRIAAPQAAIDRELAQHAVDRRRVQGAAHRASLAVVVQRLNGGLSLPSPCLAAFR